MITIIFGRMAQFLIGLLMTRVATTLLSPVEMGRVALLSSTTAFFAFFLISPVGAFINRRLHAWQSCGRAKYYLTCYLGYLLLVVFIAAIGLFFISMLGKEDFGVPFVWLIPLICGSLLFSTINLTVIPSLNLLGYSGSFMLLSIATAVVSFIFAILFVQSMQPLAQYWLSGQLLGQVLIGAIGIKVLFERFKKVVEFDTSSVIQIRHLQVLFNFAWPVAISAGLSWLQGQGYRYLIGGQLGLAELGLFVAGYGISAGVIAGFESILTTFFQPRLYRDANKNHPVTQAESWRRYAVAIIPPLILTSSFIVILAPELTRIFLGDDFQAAMEYVVWGALAEMARVLMGIYSLIAHVFMRTTWLILPNLIGAVVSIALCLYLIPVAGAVGVGLGLATSGFVVVVMMHVLLARYVDGGVPLRPILMAGICAVALWGLATISRYFLDASTEWVSIIEVLTPACLGYAGAQYLFLRPYLKER